MAVQTYISQINNIEYFVSTIKRDIPHVDYVSYDAVIKTVDIYGTFTEEDITSLDTFVQSYSNPEKVVVKKIKMLSSMETKSNVLYWHTVYDWLEDSIIKNVMLSIMLNPSPSDVVYDETFRYGVRMIDVTNNQVIFQEEYYNQECEEKTIALTNFELALGNKSLEIQVIKYNKGSYISIKKAMVEYL